MRNTMCQCVRFPGACARDDQQRPKESGSPGARETVLDRCPLGDVQVMQICRAVHEFGLTEVCMFEFCSYRPWRYDCPTELSRHADHLRRASRFAHMASSKPV